MSHRVNRDYRMVRIAKRDGQTRLLAIALPGLASRQRLLLKEVLSNLVPHRAAHGFVRGRSPATAAGVHAGATVLLKMDLVDFFGHTTLSQVVRVLRDCGLGPEASVLRALDCTVPRIEGGRPERGLPQGACTSPALSNLCFRRTDGRLEGLATSMGWKYSRYADDLHFSSTKPESVSRLIDGILGILSDSGHVENTAKCRVTFAPAPPVVCGSPVPPR